MVPMATSKVATTVHDFTVLPLRMPVLPSFPKETTHYLYLRANAPKVPTDDTPRQVFLVNLPIDATEPHLRSLSAGHLGGARVESVTFDGAKLSGGIIAPAKSKKRKRGHSDGEEQPDQEEEVGQLPLIWAHDLHRSGSTAVVTFIDKPGADLALRSARRAAKQGTSIPWPTSDELGSNRYRSHHHLRYPSHSLLQQSVDDYMTAFAAREALQASQNKRLRSEPDEDGFVTVTRGGRTGTAKAEDARAKEEELKKREKNRVREDFYRFQVREKRKVEAKDLVRGFEEDVRRVEEMRRRKGKVRPE